MKWLLPEPKLPCRYAPFDFASVVALVMRLSAALKHSTSCGVTTYSASVRSGSVTPEARLMTKSLL
ncbi:unannotated protein [freshwater metagenome]|uniref:Unannotated protein n=1 Tax=freshwater metagenome TaxID=449393 RepID=A0A6J7AV29_9ZZZZ